MLGLRFCVRAFSSCGKRGPLFIAVAGLSLSRPLLLRSTGSRRAGSVIVAHGQGQLLRGAWDPPRPGLEPVSPALAGRFSTAAPPGKPKNLYLDTYGGPNISFWINEHFVDECGKNLKSGQNYESIDEYGSLALEGENHRLEVKKSGCRPRF